MRHLLLLLIFAAPLAAQTPANDAAHTLHALFDREWDYQMQQHPTRASSLGDRRWNDRWADDSLAAIEARYQHTLAVLDEIKRVDRARLSAIWVMYPHNRHLTPRVRAFVDFLVEWAKQNRLAGK